MWAAERSAVLRKTALWKNLTVALREDLTVLSGKTLGHSALWKERTAVRSLERPYNALWKNLTVAFWKNLTDALWKALQLHSGKTLPVLPGKTILLLS